jgi:hypothetical protein
MYARLLFVVVGIFGAFSGVPVRIKCAFSEGWARFRTVFAFPHG